jgi:dTDP-4-dehydrorhamnose 3,5-epimerase
MHVVDLRLKGLKLITFDVYFDERGFFLESYQQGRYMACGIEACFVQDNWVSSKKDVLRALHYQEGPPGQAKLVSCLQGTIFDVVVDLRLDSATFGQWEGVWLDERLPQQLWIPEGFAHGYCTAAPLAFVHYKVTTPYDPAKERSIRWNDPDLAIAWPIQNPLLSPRDQVSPWFCEYYPNNYRKSLTGNRL